MIIHVAGPSGSGKSTLGSKLKELPNTLVIDTDDIDDETMIKDKPKSSENRIKINLKKIKTIIKKNKHKNIIILGISFFGECDPMHYSDYGFFINIDLERLYKQYVTRTINDLCNNKEAILELVETNHSEVSDIASHLYKIRNVLDLDFDNFSNNTKRFAQRYMDKHVGYKAMSSKRIYNEIKKLIKN